MMTSEEMSEAKIAYYQAWARMMITIWQDKIIMMDVHDTGALLNSFQHELQFNSNGDVTKIVFAFLEYGRMVDMGVGRGMNAGIKRGQSSYSDYRNDIGQLTGFARKNKNWYTRPYFHSVKVLTEKIAEMYGEQFQAIIQESMIGKEYKDYFT